MSREPESRMHREWHHTEKPTPPPPPPPKRKPVPRVRVENGTQDPTVRKLLTTTEKLTYEERRILRGYRLSGGSGPDAERRERKALEIEILSEKKEQR
ncbi:hypothetical protein F9L07_28230 [Pimelobacter simplex]|uniref:Uncharacterized protein n=1 Tax=Nocardioides simplex TaxID=2045 RepID=A0A7J5DQJ5_NOCSI|nr:hypothetical protein [Pimelobacter simplex]KAB2806926.1 hypothetical protein F9L07_28230 [Pimelobacter simplex]